MKKVFKKSTKDGKLQLDGRTNLGKSVNQATKTLGIIGTIISFIVKTFRFFFLLFFFWPYKYAFLVIKYGFSGIKFLVPRGIVLAKKVWLKLRKKE
jgi:hypothetical protein|tara:strand:- start:514 stop:801 length:288 start_codon:yes stop_codon:yes gene_type:complete